MSIFTDVLELGAGLIPGGSTVLKAGELAVDYAGSGSDGTVPGDCPGQAQIRDGLRRAFAAAPYDAMQAFKADVRRICTDPSWECYNGWSDPEIMARAATGGHDCTHSRNSAQFVPLVNAFIERWGSESAPSGSWRTDQEPTWQPSSSQTTAMFGGPSGAPMGIPVWVWILAGVAVLALVLRSGSFSL